MNAFKDIENRNILKRILSKNSQGILMLDVSDIYILKTIADSGSINKAAEKLFMSQPTLSKRISRLEQVLKVELFHRNSTGMKPTDVALYLIQNGAQIQTKLDAMCRHVELLTSLEGGSIHIGVSPVIEQLYFPKVLLDFIEDTNNVQITFKVDSPEKLQCAVMDGELDIAIGPFEIAELPQDFYVSEIANSYAVFVVRPDHPILTKSSPLSLHDLLNYPGIGPSLNRPMINFLKEFDLPTTMQVTCDDYRISKSVVMTSDYFTGGPKQLFQKEIENKELVAIPTQQTIKWMSHCIARPESVYTPTVKKFIEILNQYI